MNHKIHTLFLIAFATCFMTAPALAKNSKKHDPAQVAWQNQKPPNLFPLAHTNQDDDDADQKMMIGEIPNDLTLSSNNKIAVPSEDLDLMDLIIQVSKTIGFDESIEDLIDSSGITLSRFYDGNITGFLKPSSDIKSVVNKIAQSQPPVVPAPGVLGLLALCGLSAARRGRRR